MSVRHRHVDQVVRALVDADAHTATKYVSPTAIVRATRQLVRGKVPQTGNLAITLTVGKPNYAERKFIKQCRKAGEPLPVKKVQLKFPPKRRAA